MFSAAKQTRRIHAMALNLPRRVHTAIGVRVLLRGSAGRQRLVRTAYSFAAAASIAGGSVAAQAEAVSPTSNPTVTSSLPNGWAAAVDPSSGRTFYYRGSETTWEKPVPDRELPSPTPTSDQWKPHLDAAGRTYYYNVSTGETSWSRPNSQDGEPAHDEDEQQTEKNGQQQPRTNNLLQKLRDCRLVDESQGSCRAPDTLFTAPAIGFFLFVPSAEMRVEAK